MRKGRICGGVVQGKPRVDKETPTDGRVLVCEPRVRRVSEKWMIDGAPSD